MLRIAILGHIAIEGRARRANDSTASSPSLQESEKNRFNIRSVPYPSACNLVAAMLASWDFKEIRIVIDAVE